jgi:CRISPR system Cascade subunit CasD
MQSWGVQSLYELRDTDREPSKSGVIGLLCAALGRPRTAPVNDLAALRFGVRADREGRLATDYQTWQEIKPQGHVGDRGVSRRYYLADAVFLAGLEGPSALLATLQAALQRPRWALYLGRKAFAPSQPVWLPDGLREGEELAQALATYPWLGGPGDPPPRLRLSLESVDGEQMRPDVPVSFAERRFATRRVRTVFVPCPRGKEEV